VPPEKPVVVAPAVALKVAAPHVVAAFGVGATLNPAGSGSVTVRLVNTSAFATLFTVIVSRVTPPAPTIVGANAFVTVIGVVTETAAVAMAGFVPKLVTSAPTASVLVWLAIVAVDITRTGTVSVHVPATAAEGAMGMVPPAIENDVAPTVAVIVPPQVVVGTGVFATVKPTPIVVRSSVKLVITAALAVLEFAKVTVSRLVPLLGSGERLKAFVALTARITNVALACG
jgi:hypothetical protein